MHVFLVAEELAVPTVIVPRYPGHLSALGQLLADQRRDAVMAWGGRLSALDISDLGSRAVSMREEAASILAADGFGDARQQHDFTVDMRYVGQSFTLSVALDPDSPDADALRAGFSQKHEQAFGHADPNSDVEIVNIRLVSLGIVDKPTLSFAQEEGGNPLIETRQVWFEDAWCDCPVLDRRKLPPDSEVQGPAIIEEAGGTSVVPSGWKISVHPSGALICRNPKADA